ncbi:serine protease [Sphingomonas sp. HDW15A]|uniref:S1 family peptidase n=1 Tax=Sphingomonas sp. HDW15A TaxID=2714942 RepID=UPI00140747E1|nr:serine protease [Sphingomonas sp. HDW15A]QIK95415.1 serine protease [Sphingomonas sp. HDW15A]
MRTAFRLTLALGLGFGAIGKGLAQPVRPTAVQPDIPIVIRLDEDMDRQWPGFRAAVAASGSAVISDNADYILSVDGDVADEAQLRPSLTGLTAITGAQSISLGRLSSGEAAQVLTKLLPLLQRQKALITMSARAPNGISYCMLTPEPPYQCLNPEIAEALGPSTPSQVKNVGSSARYVALFSTAADLGIRAIALSGEKSVVRLEPGKSLTVTSTATESLTRSHEILLVSDRPFDVAAFEQPSPFTAGCLFRLYPSCLAEVRAAASSAGMSAIRLTFADQEPAPAMGGGVNAARGDSDWMVELYATRPYSAEEIEKDRLLPQQQRQFLAERAPEERAHTCGGTIIAPNLVLTAAHCVATGRFLGENITRVFTDRRVRVGSLRMGKGGETRAIIGVAVHAGYSGVGTGLPDDIALLMVKSDDRIRLAPRPLAIATMPPVPGTTVTGLGWGYTQAVAPDANVMLSMSDELQRNPNILQQASLEVLAPAQCQKRLPGRIKPGMLCLVTPKAIADRGGPATFSCRGDSGGPLVREYGNGNEELVGLTSWSLGCGYKGTPSVYTDVAKFSRWIEAARQAIKPGQALRVPEPGRGR